MALRHGVSEAAPPPPELQQPGTAGRTWAWLTVIAAVLGALSSGALLLNIAYPLVTVGTALWFLRRGHHLQYIEFVLWLWLLGPLVRRVVDYGSSFHDISPVMLAAPIASFCGIGVALTAKRLVRADVLSLTVVAALAFGYGALVGLIRVGFTPLVAGVMDVLPPLVLGLFLLVTPASTQDLRAVLRRTARIGLVVLGAYGVTQFLVLPPWDASWIIDSGSSTVGRPFPQEVRVFGTLNTAGPYAYVVCCLLLVTLADTRRWTGLDVVAMVLGYLGLGLSLIRGAWIAHALVLVLLLGSRRIRRVVLVSTIALLLIGVSPLGSPIVGTVTERLSSSVEAGLQDNSLSRRREFQAQIVAEVIRDPVGHGLGSTGLATDLNARSEAQRYRNFDSGLFETLFTLGFVAGAPFLLLLTRTVIRLWRHVITQSPIDVGPAGAAVALLVALVSTSTYESVYGVVLWVCLAILGRIDNPPTPQPTLPAVTRGSTA